VKIHKFELHKDTKLFTVYFALAVALWSLCFPALNWPDEAYKISTIGLDSNFYVKLLAHFSAEQCEIVYSRDNSKGYLSNSFLIELISGQSCYYTLKLSNAAIILVLAMICILCARVRWRQELIMLSLIWPSSLFYVTGINQHVFFHTISIAIVSMTINRSFVWGYFALSIALIPLDRSFVSLSIFLAFLSVLKFRPKYSISFTIVLFGLAEISRPYIGASSAFIQNGMSVAEISESVSQYGDSWIVSFGILFVSFVYLGGTSSVYGFVAEYLFVLGALGMLFLSNKSDNGMKVYILAIILTFVFVVSYIPTLQTFRYYAYIMPALVYFLLKSSRLKKYYIFYCVFFSAAYLLQAITYNLIS